MFHERTKHIELDRHFFIERLQEGILMAEYIESKDQMTDVFTKALGNVGQVGNVGHIPSPTCGTKVLHCSS